ncbi:MAG: hypothetical protein PHV06_00530 [bacterium]|nr:hypothetical protein [bacterium]
MKNLIVIFSILILNLIPCISYSDNYRYTEPYQFHSEFTLKKFTYEFPVTWDEEWYSSPNGFRTSEGSLDTHLLILNRELKINHELIKDNLFVKLNYIEYQNQDFKRKFLQYQFTQKVWKSVHVLIFGVSEFDKIYSDFGAGIGFRKDELNFIELKMLRENFLYNMKADEDTSYLRGAKPKQVILEMNFSNNKWTASSYISISTESTLVNTLCDTREETITDYQNYGYFQIQNHVPVLNIIVGGNVGFQEHIYQYQLHDSGLIYVPEMSNVIDHSSFRRPYFYAEIFSVRFWKRSELQSKIFYGTGKFKWEETYSTNDNEYERKDSGLNLSFNYRFFDWFSAYFNYYFMYSQMKQEFPKPDVEDFNYKNSENTFAVGPNFILKNCQISVIVNYDMDSNTFDGGNIRFQLII